MYVSTRTWPGAGAVLFATLALATPSFSFANYRFDDFSARPPIHEAKRTAIGMHTLTPEIIKTLYHLPATGGKGTIAIIAAYDSPRIADDLTAFSEKFSLPSCTQANDCFEKHALDAGTAPDPGWRMETALDVEWAHAIAPGAKILLVEAKTPSGANLIKAVDYARNRSDVVALSMSWGGAEFADETTLDEHFTSKYGATFFAASGDSGTGASWPAASPNVVAVGGTHLAWDAQGNRKSETGWDGSGGGISAFESEPSYQSDFDIPRAKGMRAIPDVAYNADPRSGFPIYLSERDGKGAWHIVGGTSAGTPQWAAIRALGAAWTNTDLYHDKASTGSASYFHDITSGKNGSCSYYCTARKHYDYVTGLGTPATSVF